MKGRGMTTAPLDIETRLRTVERACARLAELVYDLTTEVVGDPHAAENRRRRIGVIRTNLEYIKESIS